MKKLTKEEFLAQIDEDVREAGSQTKLAAKIKVSVSYLNGVLNERTMPGKKFLDYYNLRAVRSQQTSYVPNPEKENKHER